MPAPLMAAIIAEYQPPCGLRPDRDTFAEFPGLFPAPYRLTRVRLISRSPWRRLAHERTPRSRSAPSTCHPRASRAKGPRETSHNSESASGGGCGARRLAPSRRLLDARLAGGASAISRSKRRLHSAGANRTPWCGQGSGLAAPDERIENAVHPRRDHPANGPGARGA